MPFAEGTTVSVEKTRGQIETLVRKAGASEFAGGYTVTEAAFSFALKDRRVRFSVPRPSRDDRRIRDRADKIRARAKCSDAASLDRAIEEEERRLWRCLLLAMKAKLEAVASGIATFDEEFLSHIVTDNGMTIIERIRFSEKHGGPRLLAAAAP